MVRIHEVNNTESEFNEIISRNVKNVNELFYEVTILFAIVQ